MVTNIENKIINLNKFLSYKVGSKTFKLVLVYYKEVLKPEKYNEYLDDLLANSNFTKKSIEIVTELNALCSKVNERKNSDD